MIDDRVHQRLAGGIRHAEAEQIATDISAVDPGHADREVASEELEQARERQSELRDQIGRCQDLLERSRRWTRFTPAPFRDALDASLGLLGADPLTRIEADGITRWQFPALDGRLGADPSWTATLDTLRSPRRPDERLADWRARAPIRPVIFEDAGELTEATVHLHLSQRVAQRLLSRFRARGFVDDDLSRACLAQVRDSIPRVVLVGRLALFGQRAERLHDELVFVGARWVDPDQRDGPLSPYGRGGQARTRELVEEALAIPGPAPGTRIQERLLANAVGDVADLLDPLQQRAEALAADAERRLAERGERESRDLTQTLSTQRRRVEEQLVRRRADFDQADARLRRARAAPARAGHARLGAAPGPVRARPRVRAPPNRRLLCGAGHAGRADRAPLPLAGHELMAHRDPGIEDHLQWLGFVRPTGLVVSAPALVRANAVVATGDRDGQRRLRGCVAEDDTGPSRIDDFPRFAREVLGWSFSPRGYAGGEGAAIPESLTVVVPDLGATLEPDFAVRELAPSPSESDWQLLVRVLGDGSSPDTVPAGDDLEATEHGRMERLLRETGVPAGLLVDGSALRLISAPRGESSGWLDFTVAEMAQTAGRPICAAMQMLLSERRLLALPREQRLAALLRLSREFQNEVSERLSGQVLGALYALLHGFQAAHDASRQTLLARPLADEPDAIYRGLLTVVLRLVFLLYAEERDMLPRETTFLRGYSLAALHARLREDAGRYPDTMDQRYGAWTQLLALFRMVYDGARTGATVMPPRHGVLFDPDRYPFLEGRTGTGTRQVGNRLEPPRVGDGTVLEMLEGLLVLDGERLSYRALDVEQIGSVYETMMGFRLRTTIGRSVAIRAGKTAGAPTVIDLDALSAVAGGKRAKWVLDAADRKLSPKVASAVASAEDVGDLHAALGGVIDRSATPDLLPPDAMALQPSAERRRSGSHYTPRALTEPIVRTALAPVLDRLRKRESRRPTKGDPRAARLRSRDGFGGLPGRGLSSARRRARGRLGGARRPAGGSARRGSRHLRAAARRPAVPVWD